MGKGVGRTHIGIVRTKNEDAILICGERAGGLHNLFIVADGMGGHRAGEVASTSAVKFFRAYIEEHPADASSGVEEYLRQAAYRANEGVYELSMTGAALNGMGTTLSACTVECGLLRFVHIGDSRIYVINKDGIKQVSRDHSYVAEMVRLGRLTEEEAVTHPNKNVLTRALGTDAEIEADTGIVALRDDARVLICSDGLSNMVTDDEMLLIVNSEMTDEEKADALVNLALEHGGRDNVSLIII